jgi:hypothetical protein
VTCSKTKACNAFNLQDLLTYHVAALGNALIAKAQAVGVG